jgi:hypothetical protein
VQLGRVASRDYFLRYIELVRQFLAEATKLRQSGKLDQALRVILHAQEKLFARTAAEFATLSLDEQLRLLAVGETAENARAKQLGYAALLREAGTVYRARDREDLAVSAHQLALHVMLTVAAEQPATAHELLPEIRALLAEVPADQLYEPVKELLTKMGDVTVRG